MRIGINGAFLRKPATGIGQVTEHVLRHLPTDTGNEYVIYTEEAFQGHHAWLGRHDVRVRPILPRWRRDDLVRKVWWEKFVLPRAVREDECDAFVSIYQSATILPRAIRHTMVVHDIIPRLFPGYLGNMRKRLAWWLTERAIRRADTVITVSEHSRQDVMRCLNVPGDRVRPSLIAVDEAFRAELSDEERDDVLKHYGLQAGYIYHGGGFEIRKNTEALLQAYVDLKQRFDSEGRLAELPLLVLSGRPRPNLVPLVIDVERRIRELGLEENVKLVGFIPQEDLPALYAGASIFVYPSRYEGFGMPVLEALCCRTAVVSSNASSLPEVGGDAVLYGNPDEPKTLADQVEFLLKHPEERAALAERGWRRSQEFSWERFVGDILSSL